MRRRAGAHRGQASQRHRESWGEWPMHRILLAAGLTASVAATLASSPSAIEGQVPAAELAKPPAGARHFFIQSTGGKHGDSWSWLAADGSRMGRESMNLRGQVFELDSSGRAGGDG